MANMNRGKLLIGVIFAVAALMAGFAVWWQVQQQRRALAFWGRDNAILIRHAPHVELLRLEPDAADDTREAIPFGAATYRVAERMDMAEVEGMLHARHSLIEDYSFVWDEVNGDGAPGHPSPPWRFAFRFKEAENETVVLFDQDCRFVGSAKQEVAVLIPKISAGLLKYTAKQFEGE